jgi:glycosyltransferase A (GT-A) superfamily protein (DUF2064 family)
MSRPALALDITVVVMAKAPQPGRAKTRLCPPCTPGEAASIAQAALVDTLDAVNGSRCRRVVLALDGPWKHPARAGLTVIPQVDGSLADRLAAALARVRGPVIAIGMDTPQVTPTLIDESAERLLFGGFDAVLGLAVDGGYWAIGLREPCSRAFAGVPMSASVTGSRQLAQLRSLGLRVAMLPPLRDVDTFADALAIADDVPTSGFARAVGAVPARAVPPWLAGMPG